jgi:hypothetical protein
MLGNVVQVEGRWFVSLGEDIRLGPYEDETIARDDADAMRRFVAREHPEEDAHGPSSAPAA